MAEGAQDEEKPHEPTQKKLDDARKRGEIPRSTDATTAASYGGFLIVALAFGGDSLAGSGALLAGLIEKSETLARGVFSGGGTVFSGSVMLGLSRDILPWLIGPGLAALLAVFAQRGLVFAPEKLKFKVSRISPLSNAKNKFGRSGLFEFFKSLTKLLIFSGVLGVFLWRQMPAMIETVALSPAMATAVLLDLCVRFFLLVLLVTMVVGVIDFLWQRHEHLRKNRMSHNDLTDEAKQNEGDPHLKQRRRQKGYDIAMNQMLADVPKADVVIVNPTHFAVALMWNPQSGGAPVCVAKGTDEIAARIREAAAQAGVPIQRDPPTARLLFSTVEIGQEIHPEHYQAVAAAIRFAESMRRKARGI